MSYHRHRWDLVPFNCNLLCFKCLFLFDFNRLLCLIASVLDKGPPLKNPLQNTLSLKNIPSFEPCQITNLLVCKTFQFGGSKFFSCQAKDSEDKNQ